MLPSLNVSVNTVLAQQTADEVVAADSSFMFYLFKLSVCYINGNFVLHHQSLLQQQPGRGGVSNELLSCSSSATGTGEKGTKPPCL